MHKKKIVHIIFSLTTGGSENLLIDLANNQSRFAMVSVIIINDFYNKELIEKTDKKVTLYLIKRKAGSNNPFKILKINALLAQLQPDVIHCHNDNIINLLFFHRNRAILTVHALSENIQNIEKYKKVVAISEAVKQDILERTQANLLVEVVYNAIDFSEITSKRVFEKKDKIGIIQVGRLMHRVKGQDILVEAVEILIRSYRYKNFKVFLVGEGDSKDYLEKLIEQKALQDYVSILEGKDRRWLYPNLKNFDILVQPSRVEGFGLTVVEAIAAKVPVIASNSNGPKEILKDGKYGELFENGNPEDLAHCIFSLIKQFDDVTFTKKINASYNYAALNFSMPVMVKNYLRVYENVYSKAVSSKQVTY